jgi:protein CpxP
MNKTVLRGSMVVALALGVSALSYLPAMAQDNSAPPAAQSQDGPRHGYGGHQVEFLTRKLNLTPDQVTQVKAINQDTWTQSKAIREDSSLAGPDKRAKMMDLHKASQDKIRALLSDDQKTKFDALQAEMKERRQNRGGGEEPPPPPPAAPQQ